MSATIFPPEKVVGRVTFREGNNVKYGQDFRYMRGVPHDVTFDVSRYGGMYRLTAPGYGQAGNYGNGAIYISRKERRSEHRHDAQPSDGGT